ASFHQYSRGIPGKHVMLDVAIGDILEQQSVGSISPVLAKYIVFHAHPFGIHHGHARAVAGKGIPVVTVFVRKHKVESIPPVIRCDIITHVRVGYKLKIYAVAVTSNAVADNIKAVTFPTVYPVSGELLGRAIRRKLIVANRTLLGALQIDAEKVVVERIVRNRDVVRVVNLDGRNVPYRRLAGRFDGKTTYRYVRNENGKGFMFLFAVDDGVTYADQSNSLSDFDIALAVYPSVYPDGIACRGLRQRLLNGSYGV